MLDHTDGMVPTLQHELDPTDQGYIFAERSRSPDEDRLSVRRVKLLLSVVKSPTNEFAN